MNKISFIFPVYNEEKRLNNIYSFIKWIKTKRIKNFEILIISNGSSDRTNEISKEFSKKFKFLKSFFTQKASRGAAIKIGIKKSKYNLNAICAIDNAWDLNFYLKAFKVIKNSDFHLIYGPKTHLNSKIKRPKIRKIISIICYFYLQILFGNKIDQDTQCIKIFNKKNIKITKYLSDRNLFHDAEFFLLTKLYKINYLSIPVNVKDNKKMVSLKMMLLFMLDALTFRFSYRYNKLNNLFKYLFNLLI